ncbi:MAG: RNA methyltransferase [Lachnospiraceae bacterium]|nr:RNA methyltransferase [Lachnospiraceae bacterium]
MISSINNSQIKNILALKNKAKVRREQGCFIVEGIRMFTEIPRDSLVKTYISESFVPEMSGKNIIAPETCEVVSDRVFQAMSDTVTPQGILAVVRQNNRSFEQILDCEHSVRSHCYMVLENIQDPGNLGTIIRTSEGAGVSAVIMSRNTADIYNPKVVRSTMGSVFRVPYIYVDDLEDVVGKMKERNITIYAAHLKGNADYDEGDYTKPSAFLIGNEGNGLSRELTALADRLIRIPMCGQVESLNAASAATVLMYESYRQNRRNLPD